MRLLLAPFRFLARFGVIVLIVLASVAFAANLPGQCRQYQGLFIREARAVWGINAPSASMAAQAFQESRCLPGAVSPVGARGVGQFMPATAKWMPSIDPMLAPKDGWGVTTPAWDIRALVSYDRWLWHRVKGADSCQKMAKAMRGYNGGLGWVYRDEKLAVAKGLNPLVNFGQLDRVNAGRSAAAFRENTHYPRLILLTYEPRFIAAGFGPGVCQP